MMRWVEHVAATEQLTKRHFALVESVLRKI